MDGFPQMCLGYRLTVPVEQLAINFEPVGESLIRNSSVEPSFNQLEKCAWAANRRRSAETERFGLGGKIGALQKLCSAFQARFRFVVAKLDDAEFGKILRDDLRISFQRGNSIGSRQGVELTFT